MKSGGVGECGRGRKFFEVVFEKKGGSVSEREWKGDNKKGEVSDEDVERKEDNELCGSMELVVCF